MIQNIDRLALETSEEAWPFAQIHRERIAAHWAATVAGNPTLWDGRVLGTLAPRVENGVLSARLIETSFSAFLAWRDWGYPDKDYFNMFGSAVISGSDGGYIFGVMGAHTSNAGHIYPCGGSLEPGDVAPGGTVDLWGSIARELNEETGLRAEDAQQGGDFLSRHGQLLSVTRVFRFDAPTRDLARKIEANIAAQDERELAGVAVLFDAGDLDPGRMPAYALATARHLLGVQA